MTVGVPMRLTDQFDDYFDEEEEDLKHPVDMSAGRLTGNGGTVISVSPGQST